MGKLLQLQLTAILLLLCVAYSQCQTMCPELTPTFGPDFGVTITYSLGPNMRFDFTSAQYSPCEGESIGTIGRRTRFCELIAGELVWSGEEPECRLLLCDPSELSISNGSISFDNTTDVLQPPDPNNPNGGYIVGTQAIYTCNEGFALNDNADEFCRRIFTSDILTGARWSVGNRSCLKQCPDLNENGENNIALRNRGLRGEILYTGVRELGSVATYECSGNLVPVGGDLMRTCIENITNIGCPIWDDPEPRCVAIECPLLPNLVNGVITYMEDITPNFELTTMAVHECNESGYTRVGPRIRTCVRSSDPNSPIGVWDQTAPTCVPQCTPLPNLPNGFISYGFDETPNYDVGTVATHTCIAGFVLVGSMTRNCIGSLTWSREMPTCQPIQCPPLPMFPNGMITYSSGPSPINYPVGTEAVYECNAPEGYCLPAGATLRVCELPSGTWSEVEPELCRRISCELLFIINGAVGYSDGPPIQDGTTANQTCREGFVLTGSSIRTCNAVSQTPVICGEFMGNWTGQAGMCVGNFVIVNDTAIGDPLMTVPLNIADKTSFFEASINNNIGPNDIINLCYELHGRRDAFVNLVSDECISVNAHYELVQPNEPREDINIIDNIHVRATDSIGRCRNIGVALNEGGVCTASVDGANIADMYQANGISIRRYTNRVRIMVPNCEDVNLVMWVFCRQSTFWSTFRTDNNGAELTFQADMIKFVIARGFNLRETSHGIIGQFWNIPILVEPFTGSIRSSTPVSTDNLYQVTIQHPNERREFTAWLYPLTWEYRREYCLYAGNQQAGSVYEVESPNDPVIEGTYADYIVDTAYGTDFAFTHFNERRCNSVVTGSGESVTLN